MELLLSMDCLSPDDSFFAFDKSKLISMAKLYPNDFSEIDVMALDRQLENYIIYVYSDE